MILLWHYKLFMEAPMSSQFLWFALAISPGWVYHRDLSNISIPYLGLLFSLPFPRPVPYTITLFAWVTFVPLFPKPPLFQPRHHQHCKAVNTGRFLWVCFARTPPPSFAHCCFLDCVRFMKLSTFLSKPSTSIKNMVMLTIFIFILGMLNNRKQRTKGY